MFQTKKMVVLLLCIVMLLSSVVLMSCDSENDSENISVAGSITLNKSTLSLTVGGTSTLSATVLPSNASNKSVTWSSSNNSVATVSNGVVTAVSAGTATITAKTSNGKTAICTITVELPPTQYMIVYNANGGTNAPSDQISTKGYNTTLSSVVPTKGNHIFMGWLCLNDGTLYSAGASISANDNVELYAMWGHTCSDCFGNGTATSTKSCSKCSGSGKIYEENYTNATCTNCSGLGSKYTNCSSCKGFGGVGNCTCSCGNKWSPNTTGSRVCSRCGRTATMQLIGTCGFCQGTGGTLSTCYRCGGDGVMVVSSGTTVSTCSSCGGSGSKTQTVICSTCNGEKAITCNDTGDGALCPK